MLAFFLAPLTAFLAGAQLLILRSAGGWRAIHESRSHDSSVWRSLPRVYRQAYWAVLVWSVATAVLLCAGTAVTLMWRRS